jgi:tetratricopeptide (TPR) repeat protein
VTIQTSKDPVGAPIFYRDVPLMPEETQKGVIQPLGASALPLIAWRLRALGETRSRLLLEGMPTCANCHSFSGDGKTLAMDLDGPQNDKGLYAIAAIGPRMSIRQEDVIEWSSFREKVAAESRVGFMSQVSPDGQYVVTTVNRSDYVANFKDYRFLQVFYPTRGVLAWYSRSRREMHLLPGADDPHYVQTSAVWSPDGKYLVFARADAREAYPVGSKAAGYANDPAETQIRYDLFRIPFNDGTGGRAEPITGASKNAMSNSFPKISPDGRWLVYVQARNGQLMRPDSELYIVPAEGGYPRRMRCNTALMNSWHSFSPNGHWLVFSSKGDSPYTRMFLTHIDEEGRDSPAIRIENATAANRAVNIPEFVNLPADGLLAIDVPAADFYRVFSRGLELTGQGKFEAAVTDWNRAIELAPEDAISHNNLGFALAQLGRLRDALVHLQKAVELNPAYAAGHNNLALTLQSLGRIGEAIEHWRSALESNPASAAVHNNLAGALYLQGRTAEALLHWRAVLRVEPDRPSALQKTAWVLATASEPELRDGRQAVALAERAVKLSVGDDPAALDTLAAAYAQAGRFGDAVETAQRALNLATGQANESLIEGITARIGLYRSGTPFRERTTRTAYQT